METTLEQANAVLLERQRSLRSARKSDEPEKLGENLPSLFRCDSAEAQEHERLRLEHVAQVEADRKESERLRTEAFRKRLWASSGVPARHADFEIPAEGAWLPAYERLCGLFGTGFLFVVMGTRGTGKTQLAASLAKACCMADKSARYTKALDIFISLRGSFRQDGVTEASVIEKYTDPDFLVIDAMEERGETAFEDRLLNHIIDKRYDAMVDTLLITNQNADAFAISVGPSIVSRIHETGDKLIFDWPTFRRKPA